jgi:hypothetical protein
MTKIATETPDAAHPSTLESQLKGLTCDGLEHETPSTSTDMSFVGDDFELVSSDGVECASIGLAVDEAEDDGSVVGLSDAFVMVRNREAAETEALIKAYANLCAEYKKQHCCHVNDNSEIVACHLEIESINMRLAQFREEANAKLQASINSFLCENDRDNADTLVCELGHLTDQQRWYLEDTLRELTVEEKMVSDEPVCAEQQPERPTSTATAISGGEGTSDWAVAANAGLTAPPRPARSVSHPSPGCDNQDAHLNKLEDSKSAEGSGKNVLWRKQVSVEGNAAAGGSEKTTELAAGGAAPLAPEAPSRVSSNTPAFVASRSTASNAHAPKSAGLTNMINAVRVKRFGASPLGVDSSCASGAVTAVSDTTSSRNVIKQRLKMFRPGRKATETQKRADYPPATDQHVIRMLVQLEKKSNRIEELESRITEMERGFIKVADEESNLQKMIVELQRLKTSAEEKAAKYKARLNTLRLSYNNLAASVQEKQRCWKIALGSEYEAYEQKAETLIAQLNATNGQSA